MTEKEIKRKSSEKIRQVQGLMNVLQLEQVVKRRINKEGFIEDVILWMDREKYEIDEDMPIPESNIQEVPINNQKDETTDRGFSEDPSSETAEEAGV